MKIGAFIIHLARAEGRRSHVDHLQRTLPMPVAVIDAVDGARLTDAEKSAVYHPRLHRPRYPFKLSSSEIACFLSHRKAWQALLDSDLDAALVLEDDVEIDPVTFEVGLALASNAMGWCALVRFPNRPHGDRGPALTFAGDSTLVSPRRVGLGMVTLMLDRGAARSLLVQTDRFDRPVDTFLQLRWQHGVRIGAVRPSGIEEVSAGLGGSTVQRRQGGFKFGKNLLRTFYRGSVAILSWHHRGEP